MCVPQGAAAHQEGGACPAAFPRSYCRLLCVGSSFLFCTSRSCLRRLTPWHHVCMFATTCLPSHRARQRESTRPQAKLPPITMSDAKVAPAQAPEAPTKVLHAPLPPNAEVPLRPAPQALPRVQARPHALRDARCDAPAPRFKCPLKARLPSRLCSPPLRPLVQMPNATDVINQNRFDDDALKAAVSSSTCVAPASVRLAGMAASPRVVPPPPTHTHTRTTHRHAMRIRSAWVREPV